MEGICTLAGELNNCPHKDTKSEVCRMEGGRCGFRKEAAQPSDESKKEKWYQLYMH